MIEITCPNCGARYQVPAEALGPSGRDVTCSSCGHVWLARAPQPQQPAPPPPPPPQAPGYAPQGYGQQGYPQQQGYAQPGYAAPQGGYQSGGPEDDPRERRRQMADIRQMLDEVQTAERRRAEAPAPPQGARRWSEATSNQPRERRRPGQAQARPEMEDEDDDGGFLRDKVGVGGQSARIRSVRERTREGDTDRRKLMERHQKRDREAEVSKARGSGWGYTGFTLIALVSLIFVGLYALSPQIVARVPEAEPVMANYVAAVETLRANVAAGYEKLAGLVAEQLGAGGEG